MSKKVRLKIRKEELIEWYFDNWDKHEAYLFVSNVKSDIIINGEYSLKTEEIADRLGYLPSHILEGSHEVDEYEYWDELKII